MSASLWSRRSSVTIPLSVGSDPSVGICFGRKPKHLLMDAVTAEDFNEALVHSGPGMVGWSSLSGSDCPDAA